MKNSLKILAVSLMLACLALPAAAGTTGMSAEQLQAAAQHPLVQNNLAVIYAEGRGVPQDYTKAAEWFKKSAEQGDAFGQSGLAYLYSQGRGVPKDYSKAAEWYAKAARQGDTWSQVRLGMLYYLGKGVPKNYAHAVSWFTRAAEAGDVKAQYYLKKIRPPVILAAENSPEGNKAVEMTSDGIGLAFLQGAGASVGVEMAYFWVLVPLMCLFAI